MKRLLNNCRAVQPLLPIVEPLYCTSTTASSASTVPKETQVAAKEAEEADGADKAEKVGSQEDAISD